MTPPSQPLFLALPLAYRTVQYSAVQYSTVRDRTDTLYPSDKRFIPNRGKAEPQWLDLAVAKPKVQEKMEPESKGPRASKGGLANQQASEPASSAMEKMQKPTSGNFLQVEATMSVGWLT
jgi:hypothetical protein